MVLTHVERVLRNYCPPANHAYQPDPASAGWERCRDCGRRQRDDGTTCMLCESDGREECVLAACDDSVELRGRLCQACRRELEFRGEVRPWRLCLAAV